MGDFARVVDLPLRWHLRSKPSGYARCGRCLGFARHAFVLIE